MVYLRSTRGGTAASSGRLARNERKGPAEHARDVVRSGEKWLGNILASHRWHEYCFSEAMKTIEAEFEREKDGD
jgi:hypothetical protein